MKKKVIGELLYRFYGKRTASFLANLYKASITGDSEDIHRIRLDVKKIYALYSLFGMIKPEVFKKHARYDLFRNLFKLSGKIRENQINILFLSKQEFLTPAFSSFVAFLCEEENQATKKFLMAIKDFKEKDLKSVGKEMRQICLNIPAKKLSQETEDFIQKKTKKIQRLQSEDPGTKNVHEIRKHLKAMSTVSTVIFTINPNEKLELIIKRLNKAEVMIGEWHDRIVLRDAIDLYLKNRKELQEDNLIPLKKLRQSLIDDNQTLLQDLLPEVNNVVLLILHSPETDKTGGEEVRK